MSIGKKLKRAIITLVVFGGTYLLAKYAGVEVPESVQVMAIDALSGISF